MVIGFLRDPVWLRIGTPGPLPCEVNNKGQQTIPLPFTSC